MFLLSSLSSLCFVFVHVFFWHPWVYLSDIFIWHPNWRYIKCAQDFIMVNIACLVRKLFAKVALDINKT